MYKPSAVRPEAVTLAASALLLALFNVPLWQRLLEVTQQSGGWVLRAAFIAMVGLAFNLVLSLLAGRWTLKPLLTVLFMASAGAAYFMNEYGVMIDAGMFRNVAETDVSEVGGLLSLKLLGYLALLGVLPSLVLWLWPVSYRRWSRALLSKFLVAVGSACLISVLALSNYQGLASLFRNHHELRLLVVPSNLIGATLGYLGEQVESARHPFRAIGEDAHLAPAWQQHTRKTLTVLVVGESARAENFSLLGYSRDTNPKLAAEQGLIAFPDVHSCGTETAVSVPCMFSNLTRKDYSASVAANQEGLLDVLKHAGLDVIWLDNQSGCKGTCSRVSYRNLSNETDPAYCEGGECHDAILLRDLPGLLDNLTRDTVLVLHQMGSHGPEYYKRVPAGFEPFTPVCRSNALNNCSQAQIVSAYDNTLRYTDQVLASLIDTLRARQGSVDSAMLYLSDHGESLGEYNLFLHGTPYMLAPEQQKHVPMLAWFSDGYQQALKVDTGCLQASRERPLSQDNLFHSMLGLLQVQTGVYDPALDLFARCRG
ncbi:phosphoethanolamine transferase [Pseudomonas sp. KNUC1026]|uniref:phosphoethanolamine transferase n=1 Tax=Pseudomonas sp. KNUC1026 TaxID=2893890 RepID=UPI001F21AE1E|nr:phosphoethanolamine--lipid A transferase [Pseudomonas sp. KNUC1026]UFH50538.1 phosphoethanolamine--lipid A transferase [Pseudomonas sp. KNUC1026]